MQSNLYNGFSIVIPTWNNFEYLKLCVESILKNSTFKHQIILHINEGKDKTTAYADQLNLFYTKSESNIGICKALNLASALAQTDYIMYMNDDMYVLPGWDKNLFNVINDLNDNCFLLSATMIEHSGKNNCTVHANYGSTSDCFYEEKLLNEFTSLNRSNWAGSTWPPTLVHKSWWNRVGGYSEEFSPGLYSDPDFSMKMWNEGCRTFIGVGNSLVYHFQSKSLRKIKLNDGKKMFLKKWKIKSSTFMKYYLRMGKPYIGLLMEPKFPSFSWIKKYIDKWQLKIITLFVYMFLLHSCSSPSSHLQKKLYFNLDSLIRSQILLLDSLKPMVIKKVLSQNDSVSKQINNIKWENELQIFMESDINRNSWIDCFEIRLVEKDSIRKINYSLKDDFKRIPIKNMELFFINNTIKTINILNEENNLIYYLKQSLMMEFNKNILDKYIIEGVQILFYGKKSLYKVELELID